MDCPQCKCPLADKAVCCNACGWEPVSGPSSLDLTARQWYGVCKYFPTIAARAKREVVPVGPDQPLDAQVSRGPLFGGQWKPHDYEAENERAAIQTEGLYADRREPGKTPHATD